jgi:Endosomal/lysosomal potassium channel TMEM175
MPPTAPCAEDYCGPVLDLSSLDLEEIATALAGPGRPRAPVADQPRDRRSRVRASGTGIDGQAPVDLDELDLICVDPVPSRIWYQDTAYFAGQISDERSGLRLSRAIQGKGAFRRFKAELCEKYPLGCLLACSVCAASFRCCQLRMACALAPPSAGGRHTGKSFAPSLHRSRSSAPGDISRPADGHTPLRQVTLLALDLAVPGPGHGPLASQLAGHWPSFAAFLISFGTIGIIWVNHHTLFKNFAEVDRVLLFLNLMLLLFVVAIPFATITITAYLRDGGSDAALAAVVYQRSSRACRSASRRCSGGPSGTST